MVKSNEQNCDVQKNILIAILFADRRVCTYHKTVAVRRSVCVGVQVRGSVSVGSVGVGGCECACAHARVRLRLRVCVRVCARGRGCMQVRM